ncbi:MAG: S8 family serine peptidase [Gemmatimonadaceae bacterium]
MDPALWELLRAGSTGDEIEAIIRLTDPAARLPGVRLISRFGAIATCRLPLHNVIATREQDEVASLKAPRALAPERAYSDVDDADIALRPTDERRPRWMPYTGLGCVVGVLDWGIAFANDSFRHPGGRTRLLALWDQRRAVFPERRNRYGYGTIYSATDLDAALRTRDPYRALRYHPAEADSNRNGSHGSHTGDTVAGNGRGGGPSGVAPEASIVFVHMATESISDRPLENLGDSVRLLEGIDFIRRVAGRRPFVVSASLGRHSGPHDGSTLAELAVDQMLASRPDSLVCFSAGNYRGKGTHATKRLYRGDVHTLRIIVDPGDLTAGEIELWYDPPARYAVRLETPDGIASPWVPLARRADLKKDGFTVARIYHRERDPQNKSNFADLFVAAGVVPGEWRLLIRVDVAPPEGSVFHAWIERDDACPRCQSRFHRDDADPTVTLGTLATGRRSVSVGAVNGHDPSRPVAPFSSWGPSRDGRIAKPDIVAPGVGVLAVRSPWFGDAGGTSTIRRSGTSMAAPHAAGCALLMLQASRGMLGEGELRELLLSTATPAGSPSEASRYGHGHLDIRRAVLAAERIAARREHGVGRSFIHLAPVRGAAPAERYAASTFIGSDSTPSDDSEDHNMSSDDDTGADLVRILDRIAASTPNVGAEDLLRRGLREAGCVTELPAVRALFRSLRNGGSQVADELLGGGARIIARPLERLEGQLRPGDVIVRRALGEGDLTHVAVVAGPELRREELATEGLTPEDDAPGWYAQVVEGGLRPHRLADRYARRVSDGSMRLTPDQLVLRPTLPELGSEPEAEPTFGPCPCAQCRARDGGASPDLHFTDAETDAEDDDKRVQPALTATQVKDMEETVTWLEKELRTLEEQRFIATNEAADILGGFQGHLDDARKIGRQRKQVGPRTRGRAKALVEYYAKARKLPDAIKVSAEKARSTKDRRIFKQFNIEPAIIRIEEHEASRISVRLKQVPAEISAYILERTAEGGGMREFKWTSPKDRYQDAIWDGTFGGMTNRAPQTGTYRIHMSAKDAQGWEEVSDLIRVENPNNKTVLPRAETGPQPVRFVFDGTTLTLEDAQKRTIQVRAVSGLRPNNPRNDQKRDFTRQACQFVKDRGPLPAGTYEVKKHSVQRPNLEEVKKKVQRGQTTQMKTVDSLRYASGALASVWGPYRAPLSPSNICGREDFFIHLDVNDDGTAGCIGIHPDDVGKFNQIMKILMRMSVDTVKVDVSYPPDTRDCYSLPTKCADATQSTEEEPDIPGPVLGPRSTRPGRSFIIEETDFTADRRAFNARANDKTGRARLSVRVPKLPAGGSIRWSVPPGQARRYTLSGDPTTTNNTAFGRTVTVIGLQPGLTAIDCEARDASGRVIESVKYPLSIPQFFQVTEDQAKFDAVLTLFRVDHLKSMIVTRAKEVAEYLLSLVNVRTVWQVPPFKETLPRQFQAGGAGAGNVTTLQIQGDPPSPGVVGGIVQPQGPAIFNEQLFLYPGGFDDSAPSHDLDDATRQVVTTLAGMNFSTARMSELAVETFGRLFGETIAHECFHSLTKLDVAPIQEEGHLALNSAGNPVIPNDILNRGSVRMFGQRTAIFINDMRNFPAENTYAIRDFHDIPSLEIETFNLISQSFPTQPPSP